MKKSLIALFFAFIVLLALSLTSCHKVNPSESSKPVVSEWHNDTPNKTKNSLATLTALKLIKQEAPNGTVRKLKFSSDGKYLMGVDQSSVKVWNYKTKVLIGNFSGEKDFSLYLYDFALVDFDFAPDGKSFIYTYVRGEKVKKIVKYDIIQDEKQIIELDREFEAVRISFSPNGKYIVVSASDIIIYDAKTLKKLFALHDDKYSWFYGVSFDKNSEYISTRATSKDYSTHYNVVWDISNKKIVSSAISVISLSEIHGFKISPDAKYIAFTNWGNVIICKTFENKIVNQFAVTTSPTINDFCFSPDSKRLLICTDSVFGSGLKIWDFIQGKELQSFPEISAYSVAYTPDGEFLVLGEDSKIEIFNPKTGKVVDTISSE